MSTATAGKHDIEDTMSHEIPINETYDEAVAALLSPLHQATSPTELRAAAARRTNTLQDMQTYLHRIGLDVNDNTNRAPKLILHVTGTKGKGSTLAFCESILRNGYNLNTGMFTSPHLVCIRERIRVNGLPVSEATFCQVYWAVRRKLEYFDDVNNCGSSNDNGLPPLPKLPGYFRMLTLMAIYTFCHCESPKIDVMLLEVGMGGRYDSTNVFEPISGRSLIRGVTLIDYDHTRVLGSTLEQIAWEKGGIFCSDKLTRIGRDDGGFEAFLSQYRESYSVNRQQDDESKTSMVFASGNNTQQVLNVLRYISDSQQGQLQVVGNSCIDAYPDIGLRGEHQKMNASLALAMCHYAMKEYSSSTLNKEKLGRSLACTFWPGRCHSISLPKVTNKQTGKEASINLRCDGAHTPISINACIDWFRSVASNGQTIQRVLIFNCSHERNPLPLLYSLYQSKMFDNVYFCRADFERPSMLSKKLDEQWYAQDLTTNCHDEGHEIKINLREMCTQADIDGCDASTWQETLANVWRLFELCASHLNTKCESNQKVVFGLDVQSALQRIQDDFAFIHFDDHCSNENCCLEICATGSLYLVGSALEAAKWTEKTADCKLSICQ
jgi:folylpolyglutamate synthase